MMILRREQKHMVYFRKSGNRFSLCTKLGCLLPRQVDSEGEKTLPGWQGRVYVLIWITVVRPTLE